MIRRKSQRHAFFQMRHRIVRSGKEALGLDRETYERQIQESVHPQGNPIGPLKPTVSSNGGGVICLVELGVPLDTPQTPAETAGLGNVPRIARGTQFCRVNVKGKDSFAQVAIRASTKLPPNHHSTI